MLLKQQLFARLFSSPFEQRNGRHFRTNDLSLLHGAEHLIRRRRWNISRASAESRVGW
jgi:hypothetical protein